MNRLRGVVVGLCLLAGAIAPPATASAETVTFEYTGAPQDWVVPYGVTSASFDIYGAEGKGFDVVGSRNRGGNGGRALATIPVTAGSTIRVMVGGEGTNGGGFNGGGAAGVSVWGGGGATDIRIGGTALTDRVLVAGGGGAGGASCIGASGSAFGGVGTGGPTGGTGSDPQCGISPGTGGTQSGGGNSGGSLGQGGSGSSSGGGGGYYGGGGAQGPGGGGSGFGPPGYGWDSGVRDGNGTASVTYSVTQTQRLQTSATGPGSGWVSSIPAGIDCGTGDIQASHGTCFYDFGQDQPVTITANPSPGSVFTSWAIGTGGPCQGSTNPTCTTTMSATRTVSANFANGPRKLTVTKSGNGSGVVTSTPAGISCGSTCDFDFTYGTSVTLTASEATGSDFTGWTGACAGTSTCTVAMDQVRDVGATFTLEKRTLTVAKFEPGSGSVTSSPAGIDLTCTPACDPTAAEFDYGTVVTLTPAAATGSNFTDWGGVCQAVPAGQDCVITMDQNRYAEVEFELEVRTLTVTKSGSGTGTVSSAPVGIDCGTECDSTYDYGTQVTLTATPGANTEFAGWSGACTGTSTCTVTMDQARDVDASFPLEKRSLEAMKDGSGSGSIGSLPVGISCGATCSAGFDFGTEVTLTPDPEVGSDFTGWSGDCSGSSDCTVTMDQARSVGATFTLEKRSLSATKAGNGSGGLTSNPAGISCGDACAFDFDYGTSVTLTASPEANSSFAGWSGACSGSSSTCTVTMDEARSVDAEFVLQKRTLSVEKSGAGQGTITSTPAGIDCGATCSKEFNEGTSLTLTATPQAGSAFTGWSGAGCSGTGTCLVSVDSDQTATATFAVIPATKAKIGTVRVKGPGKVKRGKKITYKVKVSNSGNLAATRVKLRVKGKGVVAKKSVGKIAAGKSKTVTVKLKFKKPGKVELNFKVTSSNAGAKMVKKKIKVRK